MNTYITVLQEVKCSMDDDGDLHHITITNSGEITFDIFPTIRNWDDINNAVQKACNRYKRLQQIIEEEGLNA